MTIKDTSREAYNELLRTGQAGQQAQFLLSFIENNPGLTRAEIAEATGLRISSVCGRVKELLEARAIAEGERRPCSLSGKKAYTLMHI